MATANLTTVTGRQTADACGTQAKSVPSDDLPLFRFGLRQLFVFVAAISTLLAALASSHGVTTLVLLLAVAIVVMHVFATALGSRLRSRADRVQFFEAGGRLPTDSIATVPERLARLEAVRSGPRSPWHARGTTVLPWLRRLVLAAIATGGVAGAVYLAETIGYRTSPAGIIVGGCSVAVLCGWFAFLCGSFYGVFRHGFREAVAEQRKDQPQHF